MKASSQNVLKIIKTHIMKAQILKSGVVAIIAATYFLSAFEINEKTCSYSHSVEYKSNYLLDDSIKSKSIHPILDKYANVNLDSINQTDENGLKKGHWIVYGYMKPDKGYGDSCLIEQGPYENNRKNGVWVKYHKKCNAPRLIGTYISGRPNGSYSKYSESGTTYDYGNYNSGKLISSYKKYYSNGSNLEQGQVAYYYENRTPNHSFMFGQNTGSGNGNGIAYYPNGDVKRYISYDQGNLAMKSDRSNFSTGPEGSKGKLKNNDSFNKNGYNKLYNSNDELWMDGEFKDGKLVKGKLYKYDSDGILLKIEIWKSGKYHSDGNFGEEYKDYPNKDLTIKAQDYDQFPYKAMAYEKYNPFVENKWIKSVEEEKSTFSIDVDQASYTNFRRFINQGQLPPKDAIRVEEWLNFFNYDLEAPEQSDDHPLKITSEIGSCPWASEDDLVMIKMQGKHIPDKKLPPSNLVFLVDVSGSMNRSNKLELVQTSMLKLVEKLRPQDKITIVKYAGSSGIVLHPTSGNQKKKIIKAINELSAGGSTAGSKGIKTAYDLAERNFDLSANNRVIIATDGDWNVGITDREKLKKLIEEKRKTGVFLSVLGFGMGNLNDAMMETLADNGNGNYAYVDSEKEAERIFNSEFTGSMYTIAKDVKLQIEFNPSVVEEYRLLGYENRVLENWQFEADSIDAGDLGVGQNVIAFYQIKRKKGAIGSIGKLDFRYKPLDSDISTLLMHEFDYKLNEVSADFKFASCVIEFALCLRESEYRGDAKMSRAILRGKKNLGDDSKTLSYEKRVEFVGLIEKGAKMWEGYVMEEAPELDIYKAPELKLFPNPATEYTTVEIPEELNENWSIQVFGMNGELKKVLRFKDTNQGRIELNGLSPNIYIIKVYSKGYNFGYLRLVVQ
jgi:Ca-activated chloride channel homolog